jgi:hypothetical protein
MELKISVFVMYLKEISLNHRPLYMVAQVATERNVFLLFSGGNKITGHFGDLLPNEVRKSL